MALKRQAKAKFSKFFKWEGSTKEVHKAMWDSTVGICINKREVTSKLRSLLSPEMVFKGPLVEAELQFEKSAKFKKQEILFVIKESWTGF